VSLGPVLPGVPSASREDALRGSGGRSALRPGDDGGAQETQLLQAGCACPQHSPEAPGDVHSISPSVVEVLLEAEENGW